MNSISNILKNVRDILPYFLLIAIYFFFVNLEAKKDINKYRIVDEENKIPDKYLNDVSDKLRISIPVIPYKQ